MGQRTPLIVLAMLYGGFLRCLVSFMISLAGPGSISFGSVGLFITAALAVGIGATIVHRMSERMVSFVFWGGTISLVVGMTYIVVSTRIKFPDVYDHLGLLGFAIPAIIFATVSYIALFLGIRTTDWLLVKIMRA
ncbi:MAG TPA: hypothetical protein VNI20_06745 [Fimbriimonadaceae bacterium]|nr:hypothetical protein [Fimbriimonadaceae bacterium]